MVWGLAILILIVIAVWFFRKESSLAAIALKTGINKNFSVSTKIKWHVQDLNSKKEKIDGTLIEMYKNIELLENQKQDELKAYMKTCGATLQGIKILGVKKCSHGRQFDEYILAKRLNKYKRPNSVAPKHTVFITSYHKEVVYPKDTGNIHFLRSQKLEKIIEKATDRTEKIKTFECDLDAKIVSLKANLSYCDTMEVAKRTLGSNSLDLSLDMEEITAEINAMDKRFDECIDEI